MCFLLTWKVNIKLFFAPLSMIASGAEAPAVPSDDGFAFRKDRRRGEVPSGAVRVGCARPERRTNAPER